MRITLRMKKKDLNLSEIEIDNLENQALLGEVNAQYKLGEYYLLLHNEEAAELLTKASMQGHELAKAALGHMYLYGEVVETRIDKAGQLLLDAANNGVLDAQEDLITYYEKCNNYNEAFEWMKRATKNKSIEAAYRIGLAYHKGYGDIRRNMPLAFEVYTNAAQLGSVKSMYALAKLYAKGEMCLKNVQMAQNMLSKAIKLEYKYEDVYEVLYEIEEYELAYKHSLLHSQAYPDEYFAWYNMGKCYYLGQGVDKDIQLAIQCFKKVYYLINMSNSGKELFYLGTLYKNGWGVRKDYYEAEKYIIKAIKKGYEPAKKYFENNSLAGKYGKLIKNMSFSNETKSEYKLYDIPFTIDIDMEYYIFAQKFSMFYSIYAENCIRLEYEEKIENLVDYLELVPAVVKKIVSNVVNFSVKLINENVGVDISKSDFYDKYVKEGLEKQCIDIYNHIFLKLLEMIYSQEEYQSLEEKIKNNNISWFNGVGNVPSIDFEHMSKKINLSVDCIKSVCNILSDIEDVDYEYILGSIVTYAKDDFILNIIRDSMQKYYNCIWDFDEELGDAIVDELKLYAIINPMFECDLDGEVYFSKCKEADGDKAKKYLIYALIKSPYNREYYKYALNRFGDDDYTLTKYAEKIGVDIEDIKIELQQSYNIEYYEEKDKQQEIRNEYEQYLRSINFENIEMELDIYDDTVNDTAMIIKKEMEEKKKKSAQICTAVWELVFQQNKCRVYNSIVNNEIRKYISEMASRIINDVSIAKDMDIQGVMKEDIDNVVLAMNQEEIRKLSSGEEVINAIEIMLDNLYKGVLYSKALPSLIMLYDKYLYMCKFNLEEKINNDIKNKEIIDNILEIINTKNLVENEVRKYILTRDAEFIYIYNKLYENIPNYKLDKDEIPYMILNEYRGENRKDKSSIYVVISNKAIYVYNMMSKICSRLDISSTEKYTINLLKDTIVMKYRYTKKKIEVAVEGTFVSEEMIKCIKQSYEMILDSLKLKN